MPIFVYPIGTVVTVESRIDGRFCITNCAPEFVKILDYNPDAPMLTMVPIHWRDDNGKAKDVQLLMPDGRIGQTLLHRLRFTHGPGRR